MSDEELNELEHAARMSVAGGLAWRLGKALASVRAERDEQESEKNAERDALRAELAAQADVHTQIQMQLSDERDALRALLREARSYVQGKYVADSELAFIIDAALNKGGGE